MNFIFSYTNYNQKQLLFLQFFL